MQAGAIFSAEQNQQKERRVRQKLMGGSARKH